MNKLYDLCVATRTYKSNGQDKTNWENVGAILQNDDGKKFIMLKAHFAAIQRKEGSESIVISMFKPKQKQNNQQSNSNNPNSSSNNDDAGWNFDNSQYGNDDIDEFPF